MAKHVSPFVFQAVQTAPVTKLRSADAVFRGKPHLELAPVSGHGSLEYDAVKRDTANCTTSDRTQCVLNYP
jgi:hypothetical protein